MLPPCHPLAELWPLMDAAQLDRLAEDIRAHGQRLPIIMLGFLLLDGRNRWLACEKIGVEPWIEQAPADVDLDEFCWSLNEHRRHATEAQRALAAAKRANLARGRPINNASARRISQPEAAARYGVSRSSVQRAKKIIDAKDPDLETKVRNGEISLAAAVDETPAGRMAMIYKQLVAGPPPEGDFTQALGMIQGLIRFMSSTEPATMIASLNPATRQALAAKLPVLADFLLALARLIPPGIGQ